MRATNLLERVPAIVESKAADQAPQQAIAFFLCLFLGFTGAHRFYLRRHKTATIFALTLGLGGVGYVHDLLMLSLGMMKNQDGNPVRGDEEVILIGMSCILCVLISSALMLSWIFR